MSKVELARFREQFSQSTAFVAGVLALGAVVTTPVRAAPEWKSLFDGRRLSGWRQVGGGSWRVRDGAIVGQAEPGAGGWLVTDRKYADLVLRFRFRWEGKEKGKEGGVWIRGRLEDGKVDGHRSPIRPGRARAPRTLRGVGGEGDRDERSADAGDGDKGSRRPGAGATGDADSVVRRGGWNDYEVSALGDHIQVFTGGGKIADTRAGGTDEGVIALEIPSARDMRVSWKDIRILEVPAGVDWKPLFDGRTLDGWKVVGPETWRVEDGAIVGETKRMEWGWLVSDREYADFVLRLRFRWEKGNSGVQFRSRVGDGVLHGLQADIFPAREGVTGSLYEMKGRGGMAPAPPEANDVVGARDWNEYEISAIGRRIRLWVNGLETVDIEDGEGRREGVVGFQVHRGQDVRIRWKDIRILDLSEREQ